LGAKTGIALLIKSSVAPRDFQVMLAVMDWQQLVALAIVVSAGVLLLGGRFRHRRFSFQRHTHCGCTAAATQSGLQTSNSIVFRARKGERPQVLVKTR
jgi:hypothetical protein